VWIHWETDLSNTLFQTPSFENCKIYSPFQQNFCVQNSRSQFHEQVFTNCQDNIRNSIEFQETQEITEVAECFSSSPRTDFQGYIHSESGNQYFIVGVLVHATGFFSYNPPMRALLCTHSCALPPLDNRSNSSRMLYSQPTGSHFIPLPLSFPWPTRSRSQQRKHSLTK